jgi:hypothetical protein
MPMPLISGLLLATSGFAVWAVFSALPLFMGGRGIREAWDTQLYWVIGVPLLLLAVTAAGYVTREAPWKLALWPIAGHFAGMLLVSPAGTDLGLLPVALIFIGLPAFAAFIGLAYFGRMLARAV